MRYKKITLELVVLADETEEVVADLNTALDQMEEKHTLFGGGIETTAFDHAGTPRRSALRHTMAAGKTATKAARKALTVAFHKVV